jgi:hypothetical protein
VGVSTPHGACAGIVPCVDRYPEPGAELPEDDFDWFDDGPDEPLRRPVWWRWVAIVVVIAMVVATPVAYALYRILG